MVNFKRPPHSKLIRQREVHAALFSSGKLPEVLDLSFSEAIILGLLKQGVRTFFTVFGHGSTEIGEVLRIYQQSGVVKVMGVRSEIEASHAATALRWVTGEKAAVVTSIGPGALQAMAASLVPSSNGIGVWYLLGDETTEDEGFNMQQIPKHQQSLFLQLATLMGNAYSLHTPLGLSTALNRGAVTTDHPVRPGPFFLLLPMNTQASWIPSFNLRELPLPVSQPFPAAEGEFERALEWITGAKKIVVKVGGGARKYGAQLQDLLKKTEAVLVHTPIATGAIPYSHPQNMGVGGSKGSMCGNFAMENADLLIALGTRAVCQSDCSRTGYPKAKQVININADIYDALHYADTLALVGDIGRTLTKLNNLLGKKANDHSVWLKECFDVKARWQHFKQQRQQTPILHDEYWGRKVLTQPAAIMIADTWAKKNAFKVFFDAGDVQANGFQVVEDDLSDQTFTDSGASYMGFAVSALLATGAAQPSFKALAITGDGSFTMNPQILIDGVEHKARGCMLLLDNGRMGAITGLQKDQYGQGFATWNTLQVDYLSWARSVPGILALDGGDTPDSLQSALDQAAAHDGLSFIHLPVYFGDDPLGSMGVYGRWNVGNWSEDVQALRHKIGL